MWVPQLALNQCSFREIVTRTVTSSGAFIAADLAELLTSFCAREI
jgi:hypothetical protein